MPCQKHINSWIFQKICNFLQHFVHAFNLFFFESNISLNNVISLQPTKVLQYNISQTLELHGAPMKNCAMKPITYPLSQLCVLFFLSLKGLHVTLWNFASNCCHWLLIWFPSTLVGSFDTNCVTCKNGDLFISLQKTEFCEGNFKIF